MGSLTEQIEKLGPWFHNLHLPDGSMTAPDHPLGDFPFYKWKEISPFLPDISGWKVLDIGCNAGFYSFELAKMVQLRGIDIDQHYLDQASWAASQYGLQDIIQFKTCRFTTWLVRMRNSIWCGTWVFFTICDTRFSPLISSPG
jgi:tRNA (mo5U34)-methyltransferase